MRIVKIIPVFIMIAAACSSKSEKSSENKSLGDSVFFSTESESNDRVKKMGLDIKSEDASYLLDESKLQLTDKVELTREEYKADPEQDWAIEMSPVTGKVFTRSDVGILFDKEWRSKYPSTIYGLSAANNKWTYANAGDAPSTFSKLQVAVDLIYAYASDGKKLSKAELLGYVTELGLRTKKIQKDIKIVKAESEESAIIRSNKLVDLYNQFNEGAVIVLQSDLGYKGRKVWDVLQSAGLKWGDGDLFHWQNNSNIGDDAFFSVATITQPGYFLPESVKAGEMDPSNLIFGFAIPRNADPENVFEVMYNVVKYSQKRLGGMIVNKDGQPLDIKQERKRIAEIVKAMKQNQLIPGTNKALKMF